MGVISEARERDAQGRPASTTTDAGEEQQPSFEQPANLEGSELLPENIDPFIQRYVTDPYDMDTQTVNQVLTGIIAVANLAQ